MSKAQKNAGIFASINVITFLILYVMFVATTSSVAGALFIAGLLTALSLIIGGITIGIQHQRNKSAFADKQKSVDDMAVHQTRTVEIDLPFDFAFDIAMEALESLDGEPIPKTMTGIQTKQALKIHKSDRGIGRIESGLRAKTISIQDPVDFSRIEIQLQGLDEQTTRLQVESHPTSSLEIYDMGRHTHYVNHLALAIRKAGRQQTAESTLRDTRQGEAPALLDSEDTQDKLTGSDNE